MGALPRGEAQDSAATARWAPQTLQHCRLGQGQAEVLTVADPYGERAHVQMVVFKCFIFGTPHKYLLSFHTHLSKNLLSVSK